MSSFIVESFLNLGMKNIAQNFIHPTNGVLSYYLLFQLERLLG